MDKRPIEEIKTEAATILEKTIEGTAYADDGNGGHLFYSREQKRLILSAAESIPRLDTERLKRYIEDGANAPTIKTEFIDAYKKAYRDTERATAKQAAQTAQTPSKSAPAKAEAEPLPAPQPDALPQDQAEPESAEEYTEDEIKAIRSNLITIAGIPEEAEFYDYVETYGRDKAMLNEWLNGYELGAAIPGNEEPPAETETTTEPKPAPTPAPAEAIPEPQPSESKQEPAPSIPAANPETVAKLEKNKQSLDQHLPNILDAKQRAAFYKERDAIIKENSGNLEAQALLIYDLCMRVSTAEVKQAAKPATEPLLIRDEEAGTITKASAAPDEPAENITGSAEAEAAKEELNAQKFKADRIANIPPWERNTRIMSRHLTTTLSGMFETMNEYGYRDRLKAEIDAGGPWLVFDRAPESKTSDGEYKGLWKKWNGTAFVKGTKEAHDTAENVIKSILDYEAADLRKDIDALPEDKQDAAIKALNDFKKAATNARTRDKKRAILDLLKYSDGIAYELETKGNYNLLSCKNGILDTEAGIFYPITDREAIDRLRKLIPSHYIDRTYTSGAKPVKYLKHLETVFTDSVDMDIDEETRIKRAAESVKCFSRYEAYGLIGSNKECKFLFFIGRTAQNGKSTTVEILRLVIGPDEFQRGSIEDLQTDKGATAASTRKGIIKRFIYYPELSSGDKIGANRNAPKVSRDIVKILSDIGGTSLFRDLYESNEDLPIVCLPIATANETPVFDKPIDRGFLRRLVIIPFSHAFEDDDEEGQTWENSTKDIKGFAQKLVDEEGDAIFSYLVDECIAYCKEGLIPEPEHWTKERLSLINSSIIPDFIEATYKPVKAPQLRDTRRIYFKQIFDDLVIYADKSSRAAELGRAGEETVSYTSETGHAITQAGLNATMKRAVVEALEVNKFKIGNNKKAGYIDPNKYIYAEYKDPERQAEHLKEMKGGPNNITNF